MPIILCNIEEICLESFCGKTWRNLCVNCFSDLASFCCDIPEGKGMSGLRHRMSVRVPRIRCMSTIAEFQAIWFEEARSIQDTLKVQKCFWTGSSRKLLSWWASPYLYVWLKNEWKRSFKRSFCIPKTIFLRNTTAWIDNWTGYYLLHILF